MYATHLTYAPRSRAGVHVVQSLTRAPSSCLSCYCQWEQPPNFPSSHLPSACHGHRHAIGGAPQCRHSLWQDGDCAGAPVALVEPGPKGRRGASAQRDVAPRLSQRALLERGTRVATYPYRASPRALSAGALGYLLPLLVLLSFAHAFVLSGRGVPACVILQHSRRCRCRFADARSYKQAACERGQEAPREDLSLRLTAPTTNPRPVRVRSRSLITKGKTGDWCKSPATGALSASGFRWATAAKGKTDHSFESFQLPTAPRASARVPARSL